MGILNPESDLTVVVDLQNDLSKGLKVATDDVRKFSGNVASYTTAISTAFLAVTKGAQMVSQAAKNVKEYSDAWASLEHRSGATTAQISELNKSFNDLSLQLNISKSDLVGLASTARISISDISALNDHIRTVAMTSQNTGIEVAQLSRNFQNLRNVYRELNDENIGDIFTSISQHGGSIRNITSDFGVIGREAGLAGADVYSLATAIGTLSVAEVDPRKITQGLTSIYQEARNETSTLHKAISETFKKSPFEVLSTYPLSEVIGRLQQNLDNLDTSHATNSLFSLVDPVSDLAKGIVSLEGKSLQDLMRGEMGSSRVIQNLNDKLKYTNTELNQIESKYQKLQNLASVGAIDAYGKVNVELDYDGSVSSLVDQINGELANLGALRTSQLVQQNKTIKTALTEIRNISDISEQTRRELRHNLNSLREVDAYLRATTNRGLDDHILLDGGIDGVISKLGKERSAIQKSVSQLGDSASSQYILDVFESNLENMRNMEETIYNSTGRTLAEFEMRASSAAFQLEALSKVFSDLKADILVSSLPALMDFADFIKTDLIPILQSVVEWIRELPEEERKDLFKNILIGLSSLASLKILTNIIGPLVGLLAILKEFFNYRASKTGKSIVTILAENIAAIGIILSNLGNIPRAISILGTVSLFLDVIHGRLEKYTGLVFNPQFGVYVDPKDVSTLLALADAAGILHEEIVGLEYALSHQNNSFLNLLPSPSEILDVVDVVKDLVETGINGIQNATHFALKLYDVFGLIVGEAFVLVELMRELAKIQNPIEFGKIIASGDIFNNIDKLKKSLFDIQNKFQSFPERQKPEPFKFQRRDRPQDFATLFESGQYDAYINFNIDDYFDKIEGIKREEINIDVKINAIHEPSPFEIDPNALKYSDRSGYQDIQDANILLDQTIAKNRELLKIEEERIQKQKDASWERFLTDFKIQPAIPDPYAGVHAQGLLPDQLEIEVVPDLRLYEIYEQLHKERFAVEILPHYDPRTWGRVEQEITRSTNIFDPVSQHIIPPHVDISTFRDAVELYRNEYTKLIDEISTNDNIISIPIEVDVADAPNIIGSISNIASRMGGAFASTFGESIGGGVSKSIGKVIDRINGLFRPSTISVPNVADFLDFGKTLDNIRIETPITTGDIGKYVEFDGVLRNLEKVNLAPLEETLDNISKIKTDKIYIPIDKLYPLETLRDLELGVNTKDILKELDQVSDKIEVIRGKYERELVSAKMLYTPDMMKDLGTIENFVRHSDQLAEPYFVRKLDYSDHIKDFLENNKRAMKEISSAAHARDSFKPYIIDQDLIKYRLVDISGSIRENEELYRYLIRTIGEHTHHVSAMNVIEPPFKISPNYFLDPNAFDSINNENILKKVRTQVMEHSGANVPWFVQSDKSTMSAILGELHSLDGVTIKPPEIDGSGLARFYNDFVDPITTGISSKFEATGEDIRKFVNIFAEPIEIKVQAFLDTPIGKELDQMAKVGGKWFGRSMLVPLVGDALEATGRIEETQAATQALIDTLNTTSVGSGLVSAFDTLDRSIDNIFDSWGLLGILPQALKDSMLNFWVPGKEFEGITQSILNISEIGINVVVEPEIDQGSFWREFENLRDNTSAFQFLNILTTPYFNPLDVYDVALDLKELLEESLNQTQLELETDVYINIHKILSDEMKWMAERNTPAEVNQNNNITVIVNDDTSYGYDISRTISDILPTQIQLNSNGV